MAKRIAIINKKQCVACGCCQKVCKKQAISIYNGVYAIIDKNLCVGCGLCQKACPACVVSMEDVK